MMMQVLLAAAVVDYHHAELWYSKQVIVQVILCLSKHTHEHEPTSTCWYPTCPQTTTSANIFTKKATVHYSTQSKGDRARPCDSRPLWRTSILQRRSLFCTLFLRMCHRGQCAGLVCLPSCPQVVVSAQN